MVEPTLYSSAHASHVLEPPCRTVGMAVVMMRTCMLVDYLRHMMSQCVRMTISHSIVAPRYPWGVKNKSVMRSVPHPSSLVKGLVHVHVPRLH